MAKEASMCLLFLSFLIICCSGTLLGFSYHERGGTASSTLAWTTFLQKNKISQSQIRFYVTDLKILSILINSNVSVELKAHLVSFLPQVDIRSIIVGCGSECLGQNEVPLFLSALESIHSVLSKLQMSKVKVSVALPLSFLEKLDASYENGLLKILWFMKKMDSFIMIEDSIDGKSNMGDHFVQSFTERATFVASILPCKDVPVVMTIKNLGIKSSMELAQFSEALSKYLETRSQVTKRIVAVYVEVHKMEDFAQKEQKWEKEEMFPLSIRRILDETNNSPTTVFPTNPTSATPTITPPGSPIITVPSTNPVTPTPTNPAAVPVTVPPTPPTALTPTNPVNSPVPVTNPVTSPITVPGTTPATNPVTSYPPPSLPPPASTNTPATQGQTWCVAKTGVTEAVLQSALDYACGMGSADCSQIQQGGNCYNPNSIQNHASVAFNSYYQKNPSPTSCDFGGAATLVNTNPSSGSCIYPSSASSSTSTSSGGGIAGGAPTSAFGSQSPPPNIDTSHSASPRPFTGCMVLLISLITAKLSMRQ